MYGGELFGIAFNYLDDEDGLSTKVYFANIYPRIPFMDKESFMDEENSINEESNMVWEFHLLYKHITSLFLSK